ncbi:hypothetical protein MKZ38_006939 [Zalerion maritima]|uniref:Uncharacterized protein n=1 Tax=Zalerion maritima TaxID=339359 RepID=A0AAD5RX56_9PEZI|nr:hypothetical protein MKZ38_006939 [Zalerion maritima]
MRSTILVPFAGVFFETASAVFALRAEETPVGRLLQDVVAAAPAPTSPPRRWVPNLLEREINSDKTCGYFHSYDDPDEDKYPITCARSDSICTVSGQMRNCCDPDFNCDAVFPTSCLDSTACPYLTTLWPTGTMCCEDTDYPYCQTNLWSTTENDVYTFFACHRSTTSRFAILEAYSDGSESSTPSTTTDTPTTSSTPSITSSTTVTTTTPTPTETADGGGGSNTGAIVGGVVGGVAVIGLAGLGIFFILKKKNKDNNEPPPGQGYPQQPSHNLPYAPQPQQSGMMPQQAGMAQPYDPRQSYFSAQTSPGGYQESKMSPAGPYRNMSPPAGDISHQPQPYASVSPDKQFGNSGQVREVGAPKNSNALEMG